MQIKITGHGTEVTEALRDYVHEKVGKLEHFFSNIQKVEVILDARSIDEKERRQVVEIRAWMAGHKMIQAQEAGRDMYAAIDLVIEEAKRQVERHKEKRVQEQRRKAERIKQETRSLPYFPEPGAEPALVKVNRFARKPMDFIEAQEELKASEQSFLLFENRETGEVNTIRNINGKYELIKAEMDISPEEATEKLKERKEDFLFFKNPKTQLPTVVFRRKSGNFGLIEPEY